MSKFVLRNNSLTVTSPFAFSERHVEEEEFLSHVKQLMQTNDSSVSIDLSRAGNISSTVIALLIVASREAENNSKNITVSIAKRNAIAIKISKIDDLIPIRLV